MPLIEEPIDPFDDPVPRPLAGGAWTARVVDRARPWIDWFGARRLAGIAVSIVVVVAGGWWLLRAPAPPTEAGLPYASTTTAAGPTTSATVAATPAPTTVSAVVVVDVAGAIASPGVYELPTGARIHQAVAAAGGATADADLAAVNLAAPLVDGGQVYVPVVGAAPRAPPVGGPSATAAAIPSGPVDINRATAAELDALPGVGPSTAAAIVAHREESGPFASIDQLQDVRGIGPAKLDAIRDLVTL